MMSGVDELHGGLQKVAEDLKVERIGPMHQAGSDSLLTASTFFALSEKSLSGVKVVEDKFAASCTATASTRTGRRRAQLVGRAVERHRRRQRRPVARGHELPRERDRQRPGLARARRRRRRRRRLPTGRRR